MSEEKYYPYNLFLIGFMGTGKSSIAAYMHRVYKMPVFEMDETIVQREKMTIPEIFETKGEAYFREIETALLMELQERQNTVVSCGGGVPLRACNVEAMRKNGKIVLLTADPETIVKRVSANNDRPLLQGKKTASEIKNMMEQRRSFYEAAADITVCTDDKTVDEICLEIFRKLSGTHSNS